MRKEFNMSRSKNKDIDQVKYKPGAAYELTEPFYDNLVLHDSGAQVMFKEAIPPAPSMIPLNQAAVDNLELWHTARGEEYIPPLSEMADTLDGRNTVAFWFMT